VTLSSACRICALGYRPRFTLCQFAYEQRQEEEEAQVVQKRVQRGEGAGHR